MFNSEKMKGLMPFLNNFQVPMSIPHRMDVNSYDKDFTFIFPQGVLLLNIKNAEQVSGEFHAVILCEEEVLYEGSLTIDIDVAKEHLGFMSDMEQFLGKKLVEKFKDQVLDRYSMRALIMALSIKNIPHPDDLDAFLTNFLHYHGLFYGAEKAEIMLAQATYQYAVEAIGLGETLTERTKLLLHMLARRGNNITVSANHTSLTVKFDLGDASNPTNLYFVTDPQEGTDEYVRVPRILPSVDTPAQPEAPSHAKEAPSVAEDVDAKAQSETDVELQNVLNEFFALLNDATKHLGEENTEKLKRAKIGSLKRINTSVRKTVYPEA